MRRCSRSDRSTRAYVARYLNFWLSKFVCEEAKKNRERYPPNSLYWLICAINRHLNNLGLVLIKVKYTK